MFTWNFPPQHVSGYRFWGGGRSFPVLGSFNQGNAQVPFCSIQKELSKKSWPDEIFPPQVKKTSSHLSALDALKTTTTLSLLSIGHRSAEGSFINLKRQGTKLKAPAGLFHCMETNETCSTHMTQATYNIHHSQHCDITSGEYSQHLVISLTICHFSASYIL